MDIIGYKNIYLSISGILVLVSFVMLGVWGLNFGIDFTGGSLLEVAYADEPLSSDAVRSVFAELGIESVTVQPTGDGGALMRFQDVDEARHQEIVSSLYAASEGTLEELRFESIGPVIGEELKRRSLAALALVIVAIVIYIAWAFRRVSNPVASWKYGIVAVLALIHDIAIPVGIFVVFGLTLNVEVGVLFITALLTIMGFSVHDTIVVFDRIRENLKLSKNRKPFATVVNQSVNQVIFRSINTSFTTLLVLSAIFFLGGDTTRYFSLALILGIFLGTYSSLFLASPILVLWYELTEKR